MRDCDILLDSIASFRSVLDIVRAGERDVLFVSDDYGAVQVLWEGLRRRTAEMPVACASVDFGKMALSPSLLVSGMEFAVARALGGEELDADTPPPWLAAPEGLDVAQNQLDGRIRTQLSAVFVGFLAEASDRGLRPVLVTRDLTSLRALKSYRGVDDVFGILGKVLAKFPELKIATLEHGLSPEAVVETAGSCLRRAAVKPLLMPNLSTEEVEKIASAILDTRVSEDECATLWTLCDGRLSYLVWLCDHILARGIPLGRGELISFLADALVEPLSELSRMMGSRMADAISNVRGDTVLKHILRVLSFEAGMTASQIAAKIGRSVPASYDYANWLLRSLLLRKDGARYVFRDRLLKLWIRLDTLAASRASGIPPDVAQRAVSESLFEAPAAESPEAPLLELTALADEEEAEDEYRIEVFRPRHDDILEFD